MKYSNHLFFILINSVHFICGYQDLEISFVDVEIGTISEKYFNVSNSFAAINTDGPVNSIDAQVDLIRSSPSDDNFRVEGALLGYMRGEFDEETGLSINMTFCDALNERVIVAPLLAGVGFNKDNCPPKKGIYSVKGYYPVMDLMPDTFTANKYLAYLKVLEQGDPIFSLLIYLEVQ